MGKQVPVRTKAKLREAANSHMMRLEQKMPSALYATSKTSAPGMPLNSSSGRSNSDDHWHAKPTTIGALNLVAPAAINTKLEGHKYLINMLQPIHSPHAVSRLRTARLARSPKPFSTRGGWLKERCAGCRLAITHCLCNLRPKVATRAGMCLLVSDIEALKPSNTGWLIADVVADTFAFEWTRTAVAPALLALLADPQWQPLVVYPGEFVEAARVVQAIPSLAQPIAPAR